MKHLMVFAGALLTLTGCIEFHSTISVERDGSGTVVQEFALSNTFASFFGGEIDLLDEDELRADAAAMGPGVELVSVESWDSEQHVGYRAIFSFPDINQLNLNQNPSGNVPQTGAGGAAEGEGGDEPVSFSFTGGSPATLAIHLPEPDAERERPSPAETPDAEMFAMLKELYSGMRMSMAVQVAGRIRDTNATYVDGDRITLMDIDFAEIVADEQRFLTLVNSNPGSVAELQRLLADVPGVRVELARDVRVRF